MRGQRAFLAFRFIAWGQRAREFFCVVPFQNAAACAGSHPCACLHTAAHTAGDSVIVLGEVPVYSGSGGALPPTSLLTSVDILGADKIEDKNVQQSWELLGQLPGIQLTETRMGAESGKATFTPSTARATSTASRC